MFGDGGLGRIALDWLVGIILWKTVDMVFEWARSTIRMYYIRKRYGR